jgi:hypothetical protein
MPDVQSPAESDLDQRQREFPPLYPRDETGMDRIRARAGLLTLPDELSERIDAGTLAVGEVGNYQPDARTCRIDQENFVVFLTAGMMDFLYAVAHSLSGVTVVYGADGTPKNVQALTADNVVKLTAQVFTDWRKHCQPNLLQVFQRKDRIQVADFGASKPALAPAEVLANGAELFMLAHEMGHVALNLGLTPQPHPNEELSADVVGLKYYVPATFELLGVRQALAAAAFSMRVVEGLERSGVKFTAAYPPAAERVQVLLNGMKAWFVSERAFDEASTMMAANLDLMDDIDDRIDGKIRSPHSPWTARVSMIAVLEALCMQGRPPSAFVHMFRRWRERTSDDTMRAVARMLLDNFPGGSDEGRYIPAPVRTCMGEKLRACIPTMTLEEQAFFPAN